MLSPGKPCDSNAVITTQYLVVAPFTGDKKAPLALIRVLNDSCAIRRGRAGGAEAAARAAAARRSEVACEGPSRRACLGDGAMSISTPEPRSDETLQLDTSMRVAQEMPSIARASTGGAGYTGRDADASVRVPRIGRGLERARGWLARPLTRWIIAATALSVLAIAAAAAIRLRQDHATALAAAEDQARKVASVSARFLASHFDRIRMLAEAAARQAGEAVPTLADPALANVIVVSPAGIIQRDQTGTLAGQALTDPEIVSILSKTSGRQHVAGRIGIPGIAGKPLAIAYRMGGGAEIGLAVLREEPVAHWLTLAGQARSEHYLMADGRGRLAAAAAHAPRWAAEALSVFPALVASESATRYFETPSGMSALATVTPVPDYDLRLIAVGLSSDALSSWYDALPLYSILLFGPSLLAAGLAWALLDQIEGRSRAAQALRRTEERFELAIAGARCGIWDWDVRNGRIFWSAAMNQLLGRGRKPTILSRDEMGDLLHPEDRQAFLAIENAIEGGETHYDQALRLRHTSGHYVWVRAKGQLFNGVLAQFDRLVGIAIDITDQMQSETGRTMAEQRLRSAIESASEAFVLWDAKDQLVTCNKRFLEFYGIARAEAGEHKGAVSARASSPGMVVGDGAIPGPTWETDPQAQVTLQRAGYRWLLVSDKRMNDGGRLSIATDVTAVKLQEDQLLSRETDLKRTVEELRASRAAVEVQASKMRDLAVKLEEEKGRAEDANRAKSDFLANMSHELRTPLNAILGFSDVMRSAVLGPLPEKYAEYASDIHRSGQHLLDLVNDILDMAKIEAGRVELERTALDVQAFLGDAIRVMQAPAQAARLKLDWDAADGGAILADRRALKQVVLNLLSNAIKFTPSGGTIHVHAEAQSGLVKISVSDNGVGIAQEDLARVVKPFERARQGARRGGTGLGLAVSKALIELHGGTLTIESERGAGTTVSIILPAQAA